MNSKEFMIKTLHKFYREDDWIKQLYGSIGGKLDGDVTTAINEDYQNIFFSSLTLSGAKNFEKDLNIVAGTSASIEERRKVIQSKWLAKKFSSLPVIQAIANSFYPVGDIICKYAGDAEIEYEVHHHLAPLGAEKMIEAVDEIKPAHIGYKFSYVYNLWKDYYYPLVWNDEKSREWDNLSPESWKEQFANRKKWSYCKTRSWKEHILKDID